MNVVHDPIGSRESLSEFTYLLPMALTNTHTIFCVDITSVGLRLSVVEMRYHLCSV